MYAFSKYHVLNFVAVDLQLYEIFKITQVSCFELKYDRRHSSLRLNMFIVQSIYILLNCTK